MFYSKKATMKYPSSYDATRVNKMEKSSANMAAAAQSKVAHVKASPVKDPTPIKPKCPPAPSSVITKLFSLNNNTREVHNKENSTNREHERTPLDEGLEDSGYLSLHNSQIFDHHESEEDEHIQGEPAATLQPAADKTISPKNSPSKCQTRTNSSYPMSAVVAASTPCPKRRTVTSTPSDHHNDHYLPILKFQRAVCEELTKSYQKNKRYDWSIVSKVAEDYCLHQVIGGQMGLEYVDVFASLLSRNMRSILTNILALLGDMDLISCKKVSKTWRRIICEDTAALHRCQAAEEALRESSSSVRQRACGLTRDVTVSRVVLSCMQTLASSTTPSSSSSSSRSCRIIKQSAPSQKGITPTSHCTRFNEFVQAANSLKQHESLRSCKRCGSPATHSSETQRATCTRLNCLFDFCTHCQESYHGSTPCRTVMPRPRFASKTTQIIPGSARSKRNVRRL